MKNLKIKILIACFAALAFITPVWAQIVTMDEALNVANNWITLTLRQKGDWGGDNMAAVAEVREFKRGARTLGYFCRVLPKGYIIVSIRKELAPVKVCSDTSDLEPASEEGMAHLIKDCIERIINRIEKEAGPIHSAQTQDVSRILEVDYRTSWAQLNKDAEIFEKELSSGVTTMNYQQGEILLATRWHQGDPYNKDCPSPSAGDDCTEPRCLVGCVATAAAQIMRYWHWPPYGSGSGYNDPYDWVNMPDEVNGTSTSAQINAVAELCHEIGAAVDMDYCGGDGCQSSIPTENIEPVYEEQYRYSDYCCKLDRGDYTAEGWFNEVKIQLNSNQPIQYRVVGHSIVADGWRVLGGAMQYHMNYGWNDSHTTWYTIDNLHLGDPDEEYMMVNIFPAVSLRHSLSGMYLQWPAFPYRYFNQDTSGSSAVFAGGQYLQFLPNIVVTSTGTIKFVGVTSYESRLFTRGDASTGIRIDNGGINLYAGGSIKLY